MADLVITAANVAPAGTAASQIVTAGETITAGMLVYQKSADGKFYKADALAAEKSGYNVALRLALSGASANQVLVVSMGGVPITIGATIAKGVTYVLSATATSGKICPAADLVATNYYTVVGYAQDTATLLFNPNPTGIVL